MPNTFQPLNESGKYLAKREREGFPLYVAGVGDFYHPVGRAYDDVRVSVCGKATGRLGIYGITDDQNGMTLCAECASLPHV